MLKKDKFIFYFIKMKKLYELTRNVLLKMIAYKFEVSSRMDAEIFGVPSLTHRIARDVSRLVADEYSGKVISESDRTKLTSLFANL